MLAGFLFLAFGSGDNDTAKAGGKNTVKETETAPEVEILSQNGVYEPELNSYTIHCRVKNNTDDLISYLDLQATFYDKAGKIVGTGLGNAANLAAGAEKTIDVMAMDVDNVAKYEVVVNNVMN
jgi:hypothetical protein